MPISLASSPGFEPGSTEPLLFMLGGVALLAAMFALSNQRGRLYSASVIYLCLGVAVAAIVEVLGVRWLDPLRDATAISHASELAVIVALFATGLALERPLGWRRWRSTWLLLGVVMPLSIAAVAVWGNTVMGLSIGAAIVLGAALAPTDPVLAGDVGVGPPGEPDDSEPRFALTSEAGLNDGLAFPFVMLGLLLAGPATSERWVWPWLLGDVLWGVAVGIALGAALGFGLGAAYRSWRAAGHVHTAFDAWIALAAVLAVYGATEVLDAYGFLAAFAAGVAFNHAEEDPEVDERVHRGATLAEKFGELALVLLLGTLLSTGGLGLPGAAGWALVALLLLVIRPAATMLAFVGSKLPLRDRLFIGWFGVRGVGSVYYATFAAASGLLPDAEARVLLWTVLIAATVSILAHGLTAEPLQKRL
ncbi:MAG: cation:proton antiporter, partial [Solirubrobacteraceae bacterium]|nr:cation:proton antiporter [Solirubrobacteraceae bacterium]